MYVDEQSASIMSNHFETGLQGADINIQLCEELFFFPSQSFEKRSCVYTIIAFIFVIIISISYGCNGNVGWMDILCPVLLYASPLPQAPCYFVSFMGDAERLFSDHTNPHRQYWSANDPLLR